VRSPDAETSLTKRAKKRTASEASAPRSSLRFERSWGLILLAFFALSLAPRLYGSLTFGTDLDGPGTFRIINYDEGGSCRALLGGRPYPTFVGRQIIAIGSLLGDEPPPPRINRDVGGSYCHSQPLIVIERVYAAITGSLTVVLVGLLALMMWPDRPQIAWTSCALLGFSNFHIAESHSGTVDAPLVFFIYLFTAVLTYSLVSRRQWPFVVSPLFLVAAVWTKWYVFAVFAYAAVLPRLDFKRKELRYGVAVVGVVIVVVLAIGWDNITDLIARRSYLIWGNESSRFGTGYAQIGTWRRWIRNAINLPVVHIVGLGLPACLFVWKGLKQAISDRENHLAWLTHTPALVYTGYMLLLGPVTYYRHYLPFFPIAALLAAYGLWESRWATRKLFLVFFFLWPLLLTTDSEYNYRNEPRRELRPWYEAHGNPRAYATYYVVPPNSARNSVLFNPDSYIRYERRYLAAAEYLILSENWYDTSYPNELNGPIAWNPAWLIKTKPQYVVMYRRILSGEDPNLELAAEFNLTHFMPEFLIHRFFYGSFQLFIGDLKIYRVVPQRKEPVTGKQGGGP
jgi:hypothetical protein